MPRYFIEVSYKGTRYSGFQVQENANTIQAEVEKALKTYFRKTLSLTGSSRTDAGVHALQNFFHVDTDRIEDHEKVIYHLNAILPEDIVARSLRQVADEAHCRFDAVSRSYVYTLYQHKDPFIQDRAYYFPYALNMESLSEAAVLLEGSHDFQTFAKKNIQVFTFDCKISVSNWILGEGGLIRYQVTGNRFLRGMVRGLVGTMLGVGRGKYSVDDFKTILASKNPLLADFSTPAHGLMLSSVNF